MTKKKKNNPFGFNYNPKNPFGLKNYNPNNPLGLNNYNSKKPLGLKIPKMSDPFKDIQKATKAIDRQINSSMKNMAKIETPTFRTYTPKREVVTPRRIQPRQISYTRPTVSPRQFPSFPSLMDILDKIEKKRVEKINQDRLIEARRRQNLTNAIKQNTISYLLPPRQDPNLKYQISNITEELTKQTKRLTDVEKQVVEVKDDLTSIKEKIANLEDYKKVLQEGVTQLLEIKDTLDPSIFTNTLNNLLLEKQKTDEEINKITIELQKVVDQQKKDVPFTKSVKRLLDDNRFNDQVL